MIFTSDLCGLCVFAGETPRFRCGSAALGLCDENFFTRNPEEPEIKNAGEVVHFPAGVGWKTALGCSVQSAGPDA